MNTSATFSLLLGLCVFSPAYAQQAPSLRSAFQSHCIKCHGKGGKAEGKVNLLALKSEEDLAAQPKLLQKLASVLRDREMPPEDEPALSDSRRKAMLQQIDVILRRVAKKQAFGAIPMRRMNRFQYNNAVVDLLGLDRDIFRLNERMLRRRDDYFHPNTRKMPTPVRVSVRPLSKDIDGQRPEGFRGVAAFPQDKRAEHGFDNRADHLTMSPLLMESFLRLSQTIAESPDLNPGECRIWDEFFAEPGKPARGPINGRYEAERKNLVKATGPRPRQVGPQNMGQFGPQWGGNAQLFWRCPKKGNELVLSFELREAATGLKIGFTKAPDYGTFALFLDDVRIAPTIDLYQATVVRAPDYELPALTLRKGKHTLRFRCTGKNPKSPRFFFGIDSIQLTGTKTPKAVPVPKNIDRIVQLRLERLLQRAFRRPVDRETLDRFTKFAREQLASGASYEETMRTVVGAVLAMPDFLYSYETVDGSTTGNRSAGRERINDFELASRLALFFWSSIPDDTLLDLAATRKLSDPKVLSAQIDRMMNDKKMSRFCDNFPAQWLQLDRLITSIPDRKKYPYFYYFGYRTSMHMMSEPLLLFENVFIEDLSIMDLINPKYTWQSDMLRANYEGHSRGAHQVNVQVLHRVPLKDPRRGGVITNAAVMTMTSTPSRTQPITRGAWVNAVIFNDPPDPPPADVPPLPEGDKEKLAKLTIRERLAEHRKRADCAGCHNKIDPLGFALENYGPTGVWRDKYENGRQVDSSGVLFNQHEFKTLVEFKKLLVKEKQRFYRGFVSHLLSYGLGRELGPADAPALDAMTAQAMAGKDQMRVVMKSVAMSEPFLSKNTRVTHTRTDKNTANEKK